MKSITEEKAAKMGIPVVVSDVFGLGDVPGIVQVPCGDVDALRQAIIDGLSLASITEPGFPTEIVNNFVEKVCFKGIAETSEFRV